MDALRRRHNLAKRQLIVTHVKPGSRVLDCGCGRGGDWHKWQLVGARVFAIDPDEEALKEAETRAVEMGLGVWFLGKGDIRQAAFAGPYDVVCYNFSIQYIIGSHFEDSIKAIKCSLEKGGLLIGITPDKKLIPRVKSPDPLGNTFEVMDDMLRVRLVDGPFYADGPKDEPLMDPLVLIEALKPEFVCKIWEPMMKQPTGLVSDIYSQFVFVRV